MTPWQNHCQKISILLSCLDVCLLTPIYAFSQTTVNPELITGQVNDSPIELAPLGTSFACPTEKMTAHDLHRAAVVMDLHADTPYRLVRPGTTASLDSMNASPARLHAGGVDAQFFTLWVHPDEPKPKDVIARQLKAFRDQIIGNESLVAPARTSADVLRISQSGRIAAFLALEGGLALDGDPSALRTFADYGVTYVSLTWNETNAFGQGTGGHGISGATAKGLELVRMANELHVIPDVSHASVQTFWDVVTTSSRPVIASHSNAAVVCDVPRNLDDRQLWAIAESGGVVGLNLYSRFVSERRPLADMADLIKHARHMRALIGADHIAIGSDFDGAESLVAGLENSSKMEALTSALMDDGWTNVDICGLLGGNLLRVLDSTQSAQPDRQVRHRPAKVLGVIGNAGKATATMVADGNTLTAWEPTDLKTGDVASIRLTVAGPGVNRVAITSAGPDKSGGDFGVLVQGFCDGRLVVGPVPLDVGSSVRPYRADLSALSDCSIPTVEVSFPPGEAPNKAFRLSEVTCEVSAGNDPVNSTLEYESDSVQCIKNQ